MNIALWYNTHTTDFFSFSEKIYNISFKKAINDSLLSNTFYKIQWARNHLLYDENE